MDQNNQQPQFQQPVTPQPAPVATPVAPQQSKALAIWALVLSILAVLTSLIFFIALPLALVALTLGIIALAKKKGGKGMSITSVILGGLALFIFIPIGIVFTLAAYNGIQERATEVERDGILYEIRE